MISTILKPSKFKGVLFDLDDTLVPAIASYDFAMQTIGIDPTDATYLKARELTKRNLPKGSPVAKSRFLYFKNYLELKGEYSPKAHAQLADRYESLVVEQMTNSWQMLGRQELMRKLSKAGFLIGVLTNETLRLQTRKLDAFWPEDVPLATVTTSEEFGLEKPDEGIFRIALARISLEKHEILYIGDSWENDISPCLSLGISCLHSTEFGTSQTPDLRSQQVPRIALLTELFDFL